MDNAYVNDAKKFQLAQASNAKWIALEKALRMNEYDNENKCKRKSFNAIDLDVQLAVIDAYNKSTKEWDYPGKHTWRGK